MNELVRVAGQCESHPECHKSSSLGGRQVLRNEDCGPPRDDAHRTKHMSLRTKNFKLETYTNGCTKVG